VGPILKGILSYLSSLLKLYFPRGCSFEAASNTLATTLSALSTSLFDNRDSSFPSSLCDSSLRLKNLKSVTVA